MEQSSPIIAVIGGNEAGAADLDHAESVGRLLAEAGAILVCGGRGGVMEAACRGARAAGGLTVGILPGDDVAEANPHVAVPVATGMGIGRNLIIVRSAGAAIAIDGRYGTLSEIAFALQLGKPVFALSPWIAVPGVAVVDSPEAAVRGALAACR